MSEEYEENAEVRMQDDPRDPPDPGPIHDSNTVGITPPPSRGGDGGEQ